MILVIDNYDSFTYNLVHYIGERGEEPIVKRNDEVTVAEILAMQPRGIVISPGPKTPREAGVTMDVIRDCSGAIPILGVCLGHQAIGEVFGGKVVRAKRLMHGKTSLVNHSGTELFANLPNPLQVMRYHSLIVESESVPDCLEVTATAVDDPTEIHAFRHRSLPVWGVQFHPESILTQCGKELMANFMGLLQ
ncbi:MAG: aminodeoxychorismate/anthranilate synthase component II [Gemmatimonadaceae bacterium]|nr:aminodeoxychorismate/anthranilate synthase component II [Gemmatimonadaceae bacterium]